MYRRFGSKVTVVEMQDRIIARDDEDVSETIQEILGGEGVKFRLQADCIEARATDSGVGPRRKGWLRRFHSRYKRYA